MEEHVKELRNIGIEDAVQSPTEEVAKAQALAGAQQLMRDPAVRSTHEERRATKALEELVAKPMSEWSDQDAAVVATCLAEGLQGHVFSSMGHQLDFQNALKVLQTLDVRFPGNEATREQFGELTREALQAKYKELTKDREAYDSECRCPRTHMRVTTVVEIMDTFGGYHKRNYSFSPRAKVEYPSSGFLPVVLRLGGRKEGIPVGWARLVDVGWALAAHIDISVEAIMECMALEIGVPRRLIEAGNATRELAESYVRQFVAGSEGHTIPVKKYSDRIATITPDGIALVRKCVDARLPKITSQIFVCMPEFIEKMELEPSGEVKFRREYQGTPSCFAEKLNQTPGLFGEERTKEIAKAYRDMLDLQIARSVEVPADKTVANACLSGVAAGAVAGFPGLTTVHSIRNVLPAREVPADEAECAPGQVTSEEVSERGAE